METLKSFQELLHLLDGECKVCDEFVLTPGSFKKTQTTDTKEVIVHCNWCHKESYKVDFELTDEDKVGLEKEVAEFLASPVPKPLFEFKDFLKRSDRLVARIEAYAHSASPDYQSELKGYCVHCLSQVPMKIEKRKLLISCSPCASIVADAD
jgi:hypothetical protein